MHFVYPQKFCLSIVFSFSLDDCKSQEKLKTMLKQIFLGVNKVHYGQCGSGECIANYSWASWFQQTEKGITYYFFFVSISSIPQKMNCRRH